MSRRVLVPLLLSAFVAVALSEESRPNILWITNEDTGPHLGAYGFEFADTPNLDTLAAEGMIYTSLDSHAMIAS